MTRRTKGIAVWTTLAALALLILTTLCWGGPPAPPSAIFGAPASQAATGSYYSFTPEVQGDGRTLTFSIINQPSWATFSTTTGTLSGTPTSAGTYAGIQILVNDGVTTTALSPFSITVASATAVPVMNGMWLLPGMLTALALFSRRRERVRRS